MILTGQCQTGGAALFFVQSVEKQGENLAVDSTKSAYNREKLLLYCK